MDKIWDKIRRVGQLAGLALINLRKMLRSSYYVSGTMHGTYTHHVSSTVRWCMGTVKMGIFCQEATSIIQSSFLLVMHDNFRNSEMRGSMAALPNHNHN